MGLDFYIANSAEEIDNNDDAIEICEELQQYLYNNRKEGDIDIECIYELDPYGDTVLSIEMIRQIMNVCDQLLCSNYLKAYDKDKKDEGNSKKIFEGLKKFCKEALLNNKKIIVIGD